MIIDCHCHASEGDGLTGPWDTRASLTKFLLWSGEAGIARTVLFPAFHRDYLRANGAVARIVARQPSRFFGFASMHPVRDRGRVRELVREAVEEHGFVAEIAHEITS
jgi:predicted TIM-barrel fold metal-dependent hydrolase